MKDITEDKKEPTQGEYIKEIDDIVTINIERLKDLEDSEAMLLALESYGVDNWCGYDDAMNEYRAGKE